MLDWLKDRENITFLIAVVGFVMSICNFAVSILQNRVSLKTEFPDVFRIENKCKGRTLDAINVRILNLSSRPVVLHRVSISNHLNSGSFGGYRRQLVRTQYKINDEMIEKSFWYSDVFPVEIPGNGYANLLLVSDGDHRIFESDTMHTIELHTAKRIVKRKHFITTFSSLRRLSECREPNR